MSISGAVPRAAARAANGTHGGALGGHVPAPDLGAIRTPRERAKLNGSDIGTVVMGQVVQAGAKINPARQAAIEAEIPFKVPAMTVNRVCGFGAPATAPQEVLLSIDLVQSAIAGGMESARDYVSRKRNTLHRGARLARQSKITTEFLELVAVAKALGGERA